MFTLPPGREYEEDIDLSPDVDAYPFDYGAVSFFRPRARTPAGHQLVCDGVVIGWLAESDDERNAFVAGMQAASVLKREHREQPLRADATVWSQAEFEAVAQQVQGALTDTSRLSSLVMDPANVSGLQALDLARLVRELGSRPNVSGALAFEQGVVIEAAGELPVEAEQLAALGQEHLDRLSTLSSAVGSSTVRRTSLWLDDGVLLLLDAGMAHLGMWTDVSADHQAILANALSLLEHLPAGGSEPVADLDLSQAEMVRDSKGGIDGMLSVLRTAQTSNLAGVLSSTSSDGLERIDIILLKGTPVAVRAPEEFDLEQAMHAMTAPTNVLELYRLEGMSRLPRLSGTVADFSLQAFTRHVATVRSRSNKRRRELEQKVRQLYGFRLGLEELQLARSAWKQVEKTSVSAPQRSTSGRGRVLVPGGVASTSRVNLLEEERAKAVTEKTRLARQLAEASTARERERAIAAAAEDRKAQLERQVRELSSQLDESVQRARKAEQAETEAQSRASRLTRRVAELEQQVNERVEELASTLGDAENADELAKRLDELAERELELKTSVAAEEERLRELQQAVDSADRERRTVDDQVENWSEKVRRAQAELNELEEQKEQARAELGTLEGEQREARRQIDGNLDRVDHEESRIQHLQGELKELMEERRGVLREIADLEANRNQASTELRSLVGQAEDLTDAHEQALADIEEARELRSRISSEPLVQALMGADHRIEALGDSIVRIEDNKGKGLSIVLLDRAIERGLQIIQAAVEDIAAAPSVLLDAQVLALLEHQAPEAASAVRGLTQWSVQQRLEQRLSEVVFLVVQDLEQILDAYDESVLTLHRMRDILRELRRLDFPESEILRLEGVINRPEALPAIARRMRRMIQDALDQAYLRADERDPAASAYDDRLTLLEELVSRLDSTGLTGPQPGGVLWDFQTLGMLPSEDIGLTSRERPDVREDAIEAMRAPWDEAAVESEGGSEDEQLARLPSMERLMKIQERTPEEEERYWSDELQRIDSEITDLERDQLVIPAGGAGAPETESAPSEEPMDELEAELAEIEQELARLGY